jgi:HK97 gp10 family phage protein
VVTAVAEVRIEIDELGWQELLDPDGPVGDILRDKGDLVAREQERLCPVDTGRLKASIEVFDPVPVDGRLSIDVGPTAETDTGDQYGKYVEFGTEFTRAQPFIRPSIDVVK